MSAFSSAFASAFSVVEDAEAVAAATTPAAILAALEQAILDRATGNAIQNYSLPDGRSVRYYDLTELEELAAKYRHLAAAAASTTNRRRTYAQFGRAR